MLAKVHNFMFLAFVNYLATAGCSDPGDTGVFCTSDGFCDYCPLPHSGKCDNYECKCAIHTPDFYTAAVFEHVRQDDPSSRQASIAKNLDTFEQAAADAASLGADIIVFPEIGIMPENLMTRKLLTEYYEEVPNPQRSPKWLPCQSVTSDSSHPVVTRLSCIAKNQGIYIAANIGERAPCSPQNDTRCPTDVRTLFYNTDVVFDSKGTLVAKHRKRFPFFEAEITRPRSPQYTTFNTSFGSFGVVICFDTIFGEAVELVEKYKVENVIISTWWFDELPLLSSLEYFQGWGLGNGVNVLAANIHQPSSGSIGSLISSGVNGALNYTFKPTRNTSELLIARVPRNKHFVAENLQTKSTDEALDDYKHKNADMTNYTLKSLKRKSGSLIACNNGLCCYLNYTSKSQPRNFYLAAFNGISNVQNHYFFCQEICALIRCTNGSCTSFSVTSDVVFDSVSISGNITTPHQYPSVLSSGLKLVPRAQWDVSRGRIAFQSGKVNDPLLTAAIHGRCYDRDPPFPDTERRN